LHQQQFVRDVLNDAVATHAAEAGALQADRPQSGPRAAFPKRTDVRRGDGVGVPQVEFDVAEAEFGDDAEGRFVPTVPEAVGADGGDGQFHAAEAVESAGLDGGSRRSRIDQRGG
jgi:hypothetical protein